VISLSRGSKSIFYVSAEIIISHKFHWSQPLRDDTCLPQAGTSDSRLKPKIKGKGPTEKGMGTLQGLIPYLK
jgi:hypothetical protein